MILHEAIVLYLFRAIWQVKQPRRSPRYQQLVADRTAQFVAETDHPLEYERTVLSYYPSVTSREKVLNEFFKYRAVARVPQQDGTIKTIGPFDSLRKALHAYRIEYKKQFGNTPDFAYVSDSQQKEAEKVRDRDFSVHKRMTKKMAIESGLTLYFTGKICIRGHVAQRSVANGYCIECRKGNTDHNKQHYANYREQNRAKINEQQRIRRLKKKEDKQ